MEILISIFIFQALNLKQNKAITPLQLNCVLEAMTTCNQKLTQYKAENKIILVPGAASSD